MNSSIPIKGKDEKKIKKELKNFGEKDFYFSSGRILGSMCTEPLDLAKEIFGDFIEANLGNPNLYPGTEKIEEEVHQAVAELINAGDMKALSVGGGTEGNILALWRAREESGKNKVVLPKSAHFSFKKACSLLDMDPQFISLDENHRIDLQELNEKIDGETAAVVGIAGTTEHGAIDPIDKIAKISGDIHFHVDAAFGGFVIPFLKKMGCDVTSLDCEDMGIDSICLDPHKMGMSPVPLGLFYSNGEKEITIDSPYLTGKDQRSLRGTRASVSIPAFWATINLLGMEGYIDVISDCMDKTDYLVDKMEEIGFEKIIDPKINIASFHHDEPEKLVKKCAQKGRYLSRTVQPSGLRFVIMPHVTRGSIEEAVEVLDEVV